MSLEMKINQSDKQKYRHSGYWGNATLYDYWKMTVLSVPEKLAVTDLQGCRYTYAELDDIGGRVATFLKNVGVMPGDFVSIQLPCWTEFTIIYVACLKVGAVINPILPNYRVDELIYILNKCESKILFIPTEFKHFDYLPLTQTVTAHVPSLQKIILVEKTKKSNHKNTLTNIINKYPPLIKNNIRAADDLAAVLFTSGTEGFVKGVMLTHNNIIASEKAFVAAFNLTYLDVMLMPAPVAHATGFHHGVTAPFMIGATCVLQDVFKPDISLNLIQHEQCTCSMGATPFVYDILCLLKKKQYDISSLRFFLCGGAPIPRKMIEDSLKAGLKVLSVYGSTESVPHTAVHLYDTVEKIKFTDGVPMPGVEIRVVNELRQPVPPGIEGEEASRGPNVFVGYLKEPQLTKKVLDDDGWYYSGDLCIMDKDGYIRITGRKKDVIIRGGENISSVEIENILLQIPGIYDAAVVAMPDLRLGEKACAYVVLNQEKDKISLEKIKHFFAKKGVAKYKYPERLEIIDKIPRTVSGKIKKFLLRKDIESKLKRERI